MSEATNKIHITLKIGKKQFPLDIDSDEEEMFRKVAKEINDAINMYRNQYPDYDNELYMAMALIDITLAKEKLQEKKDLGPIRERMEALMEEMEPYIKK